jgi:hypothetical protein
MELDHGVWQKTMAAATGQSRAAAQDSFESRAHAPFETAVTVVAEPPSRLSFWLARLLGLEAFYVEPVSQGSLRRPD